MKTEWELTIKIQTVFNGPTTLTLGQRQQVTGTQALCYLNFIVLYTMTHSSFWKENIIWVSNPPNGLNQMCPRVDSPITKLTVESHT